jgi:hypothetical protein
VNGPALIDFGRVAFLDKGGRPGRRAGTSSDPARGLQRSNRPDLGPLDRGLHRQTPAMVVLKDGRTVRRPHDPGEDRQPDHAHES